MLPVDMAYALNIFFTEGPPHTEVGVNHAIINWTTDVPSTGQVEFGPPGNLNTIIESTLLNPNQSLATLHGALLETLESDNQYYYRVVAFDGGGEQVIDDNNGHYYSFVTGVEVEPQIPVITDTTIVALTPGDATIEWMTDIASSTMIYYGTQTSLGEKITAPGFVLSHSIVIQTPVDEVYTFIVSSCSSDGLCVNDTPQQLVPGVDEEQPFLEIEIPESFNRRDITLTGTTKSYASIDLYINGVISRTAIADDAGVFTLQSVRLEEDENILAFTITDQLGLTHQEEFTILIDTHPPILDVSPVPESSIHQSLSLNGTVDKLVTLEFMAVTMQDQLPPGAVSNLEVVAVFTNTMRLAWEPPEDMDIREYNVYRNGVRITSVRSPSFVDAGAYVDSGVAYEYRVAVVDESCNEGSLSPVLNVVTEEGGQVYENTPPEAEETCITHRSITSTLLSGDFSETIALEQGKNFVSVIATDAAGNQVRWEEEVYFDDQPPQIVESNLVNFNPSYDSVITVKGKTDKLARITAFVNDDEGETVVTDSDGYFEIDIRLKREADHDVELDENDVPFGELYYATAWQNNVRLVATGMTGLSSEIEEPILLTMCGEGNYFTVRIDEPQPTMIIPRLILDGQAQIGVAVNLTWTGGADYDYQITSRPKVTYRSINVDEAAEWDTDKVTPTSQWSHDNTAGYVLLKVRPYDPSINDNSGEEWTVYDKELNISHLHKGDCILPELGCIRVPLVLEIEFEQRIEEDLAPGVVDTTDTDYRVEAMTQRHCFDVEVNIDYRIPPDVIPKRFLEVTVELIDDILEMIDKVLEPLAKIQKYVFYSCLFSWLFQYFLEVSESWSCEYSSLLSQFWMGGFKKEVALTGQCDIVYPTDSEGENAQQKNMACKQCENAVRQSNRFQRLSHWVCDRIFCPSAPTFQKFIRDAEEDNRGIQPFTAGKNNDVWVDARSSCVGVTDDYVSVNQQWQYYKNQDQDVANTMFESTDMYKGSADSEVDCKGLHNSDPRCCSFEYMQEWDPACLIMNELKESKCLGAQNANNAEGMQGCNMVWNAVAGFCDADGLPVPSLVNTNFHYSHELVERVPVQIVTPQENFENSGVPATTGNVAADISGEEHLVSDDLGGVGSANSCTSNHRFQSNDDRKIYYRIIPLGQENAHGRRTDDAHGFRVDRGYVYESKDLRTVDLGEDTDEIDAFIPNPEEDTPVNSYLAFHPVSDVSEFFSTEPADPNDPERLGQIRGFASDLWSCAEEASWRGSGTVQPADVSNSFSDEVRDIYDRIEKAIGKTDQEYIVDPTTGILRSLQCVCLPGITSYLKLWRAILTAVRNCFNSIILTGDGSSGVCRAVLSVYVCDLLFDLLRCFQQKFSLGAQRGEGGSLGNLFGALTNAGTNVNQGIRNRYGKTNLYHSLFVERKLVHGICMWAFTGTWDLDVGGLLEGEGMTIPIKSQGFLYPCTRRFISYNPASRPVPGLATWQYHFGVGLAAGADLRWNLQLECSNTPECESAEGFANGLCDCHGGDIKQSIIRGGSLRVGDVFNEEGDIFWQAEVPFRFNKARLWWEYKNNRDETVRDEVECTIDQIGGDPPALCGFDVGTLSYRCGFQLGAEAWARIVGRPEPYDDPFTIGDRLNWNVELMQRIPEGTCYSSDMCPHQKYLVVEVFNHLDRKVYSTANNPQRLVTEGRNFEVVGDMTLNEGMFSRGVSIHTQCQIAESNGLILGSGVFRCNSDVKISVKSIEGEDITLQYQSGRVKRQDGDYQEFESDQTPIECGRESGLQYRCGDAATVTLTSLESFTTSSWIILESQMTTQTDTTELQECDQTSEVNFKAVFTVYDARESASLGTYEMNPNQITDYLGEPQKKEFFYKAKCDGQRNPPPQTPPETTEPETTEPETTDPETADPETSEPEAPEGEPDPADGGADD